MPGCFSVALRTDTAPYWPTPFSLSQVCAVLVTKFWFCITLISCRWDVVIVWGFPTVDLEIRGSHEQSGSGFVQGINFQRQNQSRNLVGGQRQVAQIVQVAWLLCLSAYLHTYYNCMPARSCSDWWSQSRERQSRLIITHKHWCYMWDCRWVIS